MHSNFIIDFTSANETTNFQTFSLELVKELNELFEIDNRAPSPSAEMSNTVVVGCLVDL